MSDIQYERLAHIVENLPHCKKIGLKFPKLSQGYGKAELQARSEFLGNQIKELMHNAVATTVLDTLCGAVATSAFEPMRTVATLDLRLDFLSVLEGDKDMYAKAEAFHVEGDLVYVRGWIWQRDESNHIACATGTFMANSSSQMTIGT